MKSILILLLSFELILSSYGEKREIRTLTSQQCLDWNRKFLENLELDSVQKYAALGMTLALKENDSANFFLNKDFEGQYYYYQGLYDRATSLYLEILKDANVNKRPAIVGRAHRMLGWIATENNQFSNGLYHFHAALALLKKNGDQPDDVALAYFGIAIMNEFINRIDLAKKYYDTALNSKPGLRVRERAYVYADYARLERNTNVAKSLALAQQGEQLLKDQPNHRDLYVKPLAELSLTYSAIGNISEARGYAIKAYNIYQTIPLKRKHTDAYKNIARALAACGENEKAYQAMVEEQVLADSVFNQRKQAIISNLDMRYETDKKLQQIKLLARQHELAIQEKEIQGRVMWIVAISSVIIMFLVGVAFFNRSRYQTKIQKLELLKRLHDQKERISRDLHDSLGGQLSSISIGINRLANGRDDHSVLPIQELADNALTELRNSLWIMDKEWISIGEIQQRINSLFLQYRKIDVPVHLQLDVDETLNDVTLPSSKAGHLYRIVQEATHNSIKHSQAKQFKIEFKKTDDSVRLVISDDGIGFDVSSKTENEHYGLKNMGHRAEQINAEMTLESVEGEGVTITLQFAPEEFSAL